MEPLEILFWQSRTSPNSRCFKISGRWYYWTDNYPDTFFRELIHNRIRGFNVRWCEEGTPLPDELGAYRGTADREADQLLRTSLPDLTIEALGPLPEDIALLWAWDHRCPRCGLLGHLGGRGSRETFTSNHDRGGGYLETKCAHVSNGGFGSECGQVTIYKVTHPKP